MAAPVCSGASRQREGIPPGCHMQVKSRFVTSEEQEQISRTASSLCLLFTVLGTLGSGSGLSCLFSFSIALAFLIELYLAFARQEGIFLYVFVSFVAICKILFYSTTVHQLVAKWCRRYQEVRDAAILAVEERGHGLRRGSDCEKMLVKYFLRHRNLHSFLLE